MLTCAAISLLIGALLSRAKVLILIPAIVITLLIAIGMVALERDAALSAAATATAIITGLQIGYLLGVAVRHQVRRARDSRRLGSTSVTH